MLSYPKAPRLPLLSYYFIVLL